MMIEDDLPPNLLLILNSREFDDEAGLLIESVKFDNENAIITFSINLFEEKKYQLWDIEIKKVKAEKLVRTWAKTIGLYSQHPLLLEYSDIHTELYFKGSTTQWRELFIDIYEAVDQLFDNDSEDTLQYIISPEQIRKISQYGHGLFASGPKTILKIYEQCLVKYGIHAYYIAEYKPSDEDKNLKILTIAESFVIGADFLFGRRK